MQVSLELLFHCRCDRCSKWWSIADLMPADTLHCPHCGAANEVSKIDHEGIVKANQSNAAQLARKLEIVAIDLRSGVKIQ